MNRGPVKVGGRWSRRGALAALSALAAPLAARGASAKIPLRQQAGKLWVPVSVNGLAAEAKRLTLIGPVVSARVASISAVI